MVAICVERSLYFPLGILGILKAGAGYVPLDITHPAERLEFILADSRPAVLLTQSHLLGSLPGYAGPIVCLDTVVGQGLAAGQDAAGQDAAAVTGEGLAYVIYTSGSTGLPKGVMISHHSVADLALSMSAEIGVRPADRVLQFATSCFDVSVLEVFVALCSGCCLVMADQEIVLNPAALTSLMIDQQITLVDIPPAVLELLPADAFEALRIQLIGGEAFSGELATRWQAPGRRAFNGYGPTEATVTMTLMELAGRYERTPPIGFPMPNHQTYVLDAGMRPVPVGVKGELYLGGHGLARGYLGRPGMTAARFVPDPFGASPGARLYRTGDLARYGGDGALDFIGRSDDQIKIRGYRIEIGEIEAVLGACPGVRHAVVAVRETPAESRHLISFVMPEPGVRLDPGQLRRQLSERLPAYMVPARIIPVAALSLTPSGKVDRAALPAVDDADAAAAAAAAAGQPRVEPRTDLERILADEVFARALGIADVGIHDSFFGLGGNSLQLVELQWRISDALSIEVPLRTLITTQSVSELADYLMTRGLSAGPPTVTDAGRPISSRP